MTRPLSLLLALLALLLVAGCPTAGDDDDSAASDDDDATLDDDDTATDDDDSAADDDDSAADDDDSAADDDDSATDDDDSAAAEGFTGTFLDSWGAFQTVDPDSWTSGVYPDASVFWISQQGPEWLVAENDGANTWNPGLWSRFDLVTDPAGDLWFCQTAYDAADEAAALATPAADGTDPANTGCGGFSWTRLDPHPQGPMALVGDFIDAYGTHHSLRQGSWDARSGATLSAYTLTDYDNDAGYMIGQNGAENAFNPSLWSRFDVTLYGGSWYVCQTAYDAPDEATALATPPADASDPTASGCGGFSWTEMGQDQGLFALIGSYTDSWGTEHAIEQDIWTTSPGVPGSEAAYWIVQYDNDATWALAQNDAANAYNAGLWSRFDWTEFQGHTWYCQTAYDAATPEDAANTPAADPTDPSADGCGGFSWTDLTP